MDRFRFRVCHSQSDDLSELKPRTVRRAKVKWQPVLGSTAQKTLAVPQRLYSLSRRASRPGAVVDERVGQWSADAFVEQEEDQGDFRPLSVNSYRYCPACALIATTSGRPLSAITTSQALSGRADTSLSIHPRPRKATRMRRIMFAERRRSAPGPAIHDWLHEPDKCFVDQSGDLERTPGTLAPHIPGERGGEAPHGPEERIAPAVMPSIGTGSQSRLMCM